MNISKEKIEVTIEDEGEGFDHSSISNYDERLFEENGRGMILVSSIVDKYKYNKYEYKFQLLYL